MSTFVIAAAGAPRDLCGSLRDALAPVLGFEPRVCLANPTDLRDALGATDSREILILPASLEWNLWQRESLGQMVAEARRANSEAAIHFDDPDPCDPMIVDALAERAAPFIEDRRRSGILLTPDGCGDPSSRAQMYRLMRLLWERLGVAAGEVAFVRHGQPFLAHVIQSSYGAQVMESGAEAPRGLKSAVHQGGEGLRGEELKVPARASAIESLDDRFEWLVIPPALWPVETVEYARVIVENSKLPFQFVEPQEKDSRVVTWLASRAVKLWREKRTREEQRERSAKWKQAAAAIHRIGGGIAARVPDGNAMRRVVEEILPERCNPAIVKVTWHGYATGTYTDPAALDLLLSALPARAIVVEGHTSSRNLGDADFDWETEARANRAWIRQQDAEYLRRTGLQDVLAKHRAEYVNVTEEYWDEDEPCDPAAFIPRVLLQHRGTPLISFAKFKGPTRLGISNLFGLIPTPLRSAWHGPNITWFAKACCEIAKLYGAHFEICGLVEGLYSAVRWNRQGRYRSRWGNYDLIRDAACVTASRGLVAADILAARLQGQDVRKSAFFDVVREYLGWDDEAASADLTDASPVADALPADGLGGIVDRLAG